MQISRRSLLVGTASCLWAQDSTFSIDVNVVSLLATVHDPDGRVAKNLTRDKFVLKEDGTPQTIRYFSSESDLPLTIGLLVDTSRSRTGVMEPERKASYVFLDRVLRPDIGPSSLISTLGSRSFKASPPLARNLRRHWMA